MSAVNLDEFAKRAIIGWFHIIWKQTRWKLFAAPVIGEALTTIALSAAGLVSTVAILFIGLSLAVHSFPLTILP